MPEAAAYPRELVRIKPSEKAFSATEIVYHVLDVERLWQMRLRGLRDGTTTHFQQMDPDAVAIDKRYNEKPYDEGMKAFDAARKETYDLVRSLKPREFDLKGVHSKYGPMDVFRILEIVEDHDHTHAAQLRRTLAQVTPAQVTPVTLPSAS